MNKKVNGLIFLLIFLFSNSLYAMGGYVGAGLGTATTKSDNPGATEDGGSTSVSARVGMVFANSFSLGLNIGSWTKSSESSGIKVTSLIYPVAIEGNWHILSDNNGPYIGASIASVLEATSVEIVGFTETTSSESNTAVGGQVGWNFGLGRSHSIGLEVRHYQVDDEPFKYTFTSGLVMYNFWFGGRK